MTKQAISLTEAKTFLKSKNYPLIEIDDHGYVALIGHYGSDESICQTARMTTNSNNASTASIESLIRYLIRHKHTSPFEDSLLEFEIALPIFVERQWVRHRTAGLNEVSGRYCELHCETWELPDSRICFEPLEGTSRQGSGAPFPDNKLSGIRDSYNATINHSVETYKELRNQGLSCEVSRTCLPLNTYTRKRWWCNLHNILHFLELRIDKTAQKEIQDYANAVAYFVKEKFPLTFKAFEDYRLNAVNFSKLENSILGDVFKTMDPVTLKSTLEEKRKQFGKTEFVEFLNKLGKCGVNVSELQIGWTMNDLHPNLIPK